MKFKLIIECPQCMVNVDASECGEHVYHGSEVEDIYKTVLLSCPVCSRPILAAQEFVQVSISEAEWRTNGRLWPFPEKYLSWDAPEIVYNSYEEAKKCFKASAYSACAVMCGRVIEGICREHMPEHQKRLYIAQGLQLLVDKGVIDAKMYEWGIAVNVQRNVGAHADIKEEITKADANDLLDFTYAMCEYIYVLSKKYESFMKRRGST